MSRPGTQSLLTLLLILTAVLAAGIAQPAHAQYRGAPAGWPYVASGYYASAAPAYGYAPYYGYSYYGYAPSYYYGYRRGAGDFQLGGDY